MNFKHICKVFCRYFGPDEGVSSGSKLCLTSVECIDLKTGAYQGTSWLIAFFFPTCQVRVVRFYQSCSSPPRLALLLLLFLLVLLLVLLLLRLLLQFLLDRVCINFHLNFRLANSSPSSSPTSQLSAHCWTSTWDNPSSVCTAGPQPGTFPAPVCTAGPQPGTFPAQCAPLDLNLGPSQLSMHRWTSTWDLPSSVCTAGPQPGTFPAQCAPLDLNLGPSQLNHHPLDLNGQIE